ncbi:MAG TPA: alpha/beta family hydrolase [Baekduia sp.]
MAEDSDDEVVEIETPHGVARAHLARAGGERAALLIGHGAGGGVTAPDLMAARRAALDSGVSVARVEQPYRVAGRRSVAPVGQLDAAWLAVHAALEAGAFDGLAIVSGGRSSGARVACRTAGATGVAAVLCLAFPLHPPRRRPDAELKTRLPELEAVEVPVLIVQGERDPFGMPPAAAPLREVVVVPGDHSLRSGSKLVAPAVAAWLTKVVV